MGCGGGSTIAKAAPGSSSPTIDSATSLGCIGLVIASSFRLTQYREAEVSAERSDKTAKDLSPAADAARVPGADVQLPRWISVELLTAYRRYRQRRLDQSLVRHRAQPVSSLPPRLWSGYSSSCSNGGAITFAALYGYPHWEEEKVRTRGAVF